MTQDPRHRHIRDFCYPLPDERIAKFPLAQRDQSKLLVYQHGQISETHFTSLPDYLEPGTLMIFVMIRASTGKMQYMTIPARKSFKTI